MITDGKKQFFFTVKAHVLRLIYILFILSFFMPYATVTGCSSKKVTDFTGLDMVMYTEGIIYIVPVAIFLFFLVSSFIKIKADRFLHLEAFMFNWKALMASLAGVILIVVPQLQFLFDDFEPRAGLITAVLCCLAAFTDSMGNTIMYIKKYKDESGFRITGSGDYPRTWYGVNWIIIVCALAVVPYYFIENINDISIAFILLFFMTIPFVMSQVIVLAALVKNEPWSVK